MNKNIKKCFILSGVLSCNYLLNKKYNVNSLLHTNIINNSYIKNILESYKNSRLFNINAIHCYNNSKKNLISYSRKQVSEHNNKDKRVWVTYEDGVYDITDFIESHPGGTKKIMMAAGGSIEPFWALYTFHKTENIKKLLEDYRIGTLNKEDILKPEDIKKFKDTENARIEDRTSELIVLNKFPYNAEAPEESLANNFYTPKELLFVRSHNAVPNKIDLDKYEFTLEIPDELSNYKTHKLKLTDILNKYKTTGKNTILACAGLRRSQVVIDGETPQGLQWKSGAIANGYWEGIAIKDLLADYGYNIINCENLHLICEGNDSDIQGENYNVSVPLKFAIEQGLLAYKYNGEDIPLDNGYPMRLIIAGSVGVRNVKWVKNIRVSDKMASGPYQQKDYKIVKDKKADMSKIKPVYKWEINSSILSPINNKDIKLDDIMTEKAGLIPIKGWAFGTDGAEISKIEISFDNGKTWYNVDDYKYVKNDDGKVYGWTLWNYNLDLSKNRHYISNNKLNIAVKAVDKLGNQQVPEVNQAWNVRGILNNSYHRISVNMI